MLSFRTTSVRTFDSVRQAKRQKIAVGVTAFSRSGGRTNELGRRIRLAIGKVVNEVLSSFLMIHNVYSTQ